MVCLKLPGLAWPGLAYQPRLIGVWNWRWISGRSVEIAGRKHFCLPSGLYIVLFHSMYFKSLENKSAPAHNLYRLDRLYRQTVVPPMRRSTVGDRAFPVAASRV